MCINFEKGYTLHIIIVIFFVDSIFISHFYPYYNGYYQKSFIQFLFFFITDILSNILLIVLNNYDIHHHLQCRFNTLFHHRQYLPPLHVFLYKIIHKSIIFF